MKGFVTVKRTLVLDKESYDIFNNFGILIDDMIYNNRDDSHSLCELQIAYEEYKETFDEIKIENV